MLTSERLQQTREVAKAYSESMAVLVRQSVRREEYLKSTPEMRKTFLSPAVDEGVSIVIWDRAIPPQRIRVDGSEHNQRLIEKPMAPHVSHEVPAPAVVKLAIVVGKDGSVLEVEPLAGSDPLIAPAVDAVRQWKYQPTLLNGRAVEVETTVDVPFAVET